VDGYNPRVRVTAGDRFMGGPNAGIRGDGTLRRSIGPARLAPWWGDTEGSMVEVGTQARTPARSCQPLSAGIPKFLLSIGCCGAQT